MRVRSKTSNNVNLPLKRQHDHIEISPEDIKDYGQLIEYLERNIGEIIKERPDAKTLSKHLEKRIPNIKSLPGKKEYKTAFHMYEGRWTRFQKKLKKPQQDPIQPFGRNEAKLKDWEIDHLKLQDCKKKLKQAYRTIQQLEDDKLVL